MFTSPWSIPPVFPDFSWPSSSPRPPSSFFIFLFLAQPSASRRRRQSDGQGLMPQVYATIMHVSGPRPRIVPSALLRRRQFSDNAVENVNAQIGLVVGLVVGLFLVASGAFLYVYRDSIRFSNRRHARRGEHGHRRRRKSASSKSSGSSKASDAAPAPPDDPPPDEPA